MSNPLSHAGQTARPEDKAKPSPDQQTGAAGAEERQQNPTDEPGGTLEQHPRTKPAPANPPANPPASPGSGQKEIKDLKPGEAPPESSAGS